MKKLLTAALLSVAFISTLSAGNPILKKGDKGFLYIADPAAEVYNGKVYVYCSRDVEDAVGYSTMQDYVILESSDMKTWKNHGIFFKPRELSWADGQMNAPDAAYKDGWYYFYFPYNKTEVGVMKSKSPVKGWKEAYKGSIATIFDPTVFVDDDGQAYIVGSDNKKNIGEKGRHIQIAKLKDNMIELDGGWQRVTEEPVNEAAHVFKRNGKYYFTARKGNRTGCWIADEIMPKKGYAKFTGYITPEQKDAPAHNSFIEFGGEWYIFYQRGDVNDGSYFKRSSCFDKIEFNKDGTIKPVNYTLD